MSIATSYLYVKMKDRKDTKSCVPLMILYYNLSWIIVFTLDIGICGQRKKEGNTMEIRGLTDVGILFLPATFRPIVQLWCIIG